ncbi:unnamed protein product [Blepharisma stoltei]|uniref:SURF1-like protein n=1 Tax=Blepharisma stoltei TaxID=1481888 RepID=A0AAU9K1W2_9CILI|nr:unnamed protein product [Blepharisma stoltei]
MGLGKKVAATIIFGSGTLICAQAGFWQLRRKKWKESLIEERSQHLNDKPYIVSDDFHPWEKDPEYWNFRPIQIKGKFDHSKEMLLLRKYENRNGYKVVTPMTTENNKEILVNRGWIPVDLKPLSKRKEPEGTVEVAGVLRLSEMPSNYMPKNSPEIGEWYYIDIDEMSKYAGLKNPSNMMIHEINFERSREVYDGEELTEIPLKSVKSELISWFVMPETHMTYAMFWFSSSTICLLFNILALLGKF